MQCHFLYLWKGKRSLCLRVACFSFLCFTTVISTESNSNFTGLTSRNEIVLHFLLCKLINYASVKQHLEPLINTCHCFYMTNLGNDALSFCQTSLAWFEARWILTLRGTWKKVEADRRTFHYRFQLLCSQIHRAEKPFPFAVSFFMHDIESIIYIV